METIRFSITIQADQRQDFARFLDCETAYGNVVSWGEAYKKGAGVFYITVPNGIAIWNLRAAWENINNAAVR